MTVSAPRKTEEPAKLARQVLQLQEHFPELYDYLTARDRSIQHVLKRIPSRADIELSSVFDARTYLEKAMRELASGVADLCERESLSEQPENEVIHG